MVVTCGQMQEAERAALARGITAAQLMEEAGAGIAAVLAQFFPRAGHAVLYLGKGNNAGDALVAARHLAAAGWTICARPVFDPSEFKELPAGHWKAGAGFIRRLSSADELRSVPGAVVLLDGLVGIGATGPLRGGLAAAVDEMNRVRRARHAVTVALDLPSGLDPAGGLPGPATVQADLTIAIAHVKDLLLADGATGCVGRLAVVPLGELAGAAGDASRRALTPPVLLPMLPRRPFDLHKGGAGRVGVIAGSRGFLGAAVLCATGAVRGGAGLVTLFARESVYPLLAASAPPEIMVKPVKDWRGALSEKLDALAIGPGLGREHEEEALEVIARAEVPVVVDADALNMLARRGCDSLRNSAGPRLLTPHPGEMARLVEGEPGWRTMDRAGTAAAFVERHAPVALLLKGARTVIAAKDHPLSFNTTGHPGMATGGMGDVLTGLCAALAAQGAGLPDAACLGAWLCGRAAEIAVCEGAQSEESLAARDVAAGLGGAFRDLRRLVF